MWSKVIPEVCKILEDAGIKYHADASSSLFVHGYDFDMDDFDITVEWNCIEQARELFMAASPTEITGISPQQFQFELGGHLIDIMSYESDSGIGPETERTRVNYAGARIWSKKPGFYLNRMKKEHPLREAALLHFNSGSSSHGNLC